ncbi:MAG: histidine kinase [Microbacteriaceae bacterium]|nr:histidine kinase [Microbacteriaceae bacterium]
MRWGTTIGRPGRMRRRLTFSTQTFLLQMGVLLLVVLSTAALYVWLTYQRLTTETESRALAVAQSVAADTDVRVEVAKLSGAASLPSNSVLRQGPLQEIGEAIRMRTHALFVVITDDDGMRLSHPTASLLGQRVSTSPSGALSGKEVVEEQSGTLGPSARAKVPIWNSGHNAIVGEVSVGFSTQDVLASAGAAISPILLTVAGALVAGALASTFLVRRLRHLTLGLEPEEISTLVQDQEVVLYGVAEGVIGIAPDGRVTVCNAKARRLLRLGDVAGRQIRSLSIPAPIIGLLDDAGVGGAATVQVVVGPSVLLVAARKVIRGNSDLGWVLTVLDRTQVEELSRQLDAVGALSTALRIQRHEFANRLHTASGLLNIGEVEEAALYLRQTLETGPLKYPVEHGDRLQDSYLQAFVGAKGFQASERGVLLRIGAGTLIRGTVADPQDITTVLGNLIDNAIEASVRGSSTPRGVELELLSEDDTLHIVVADSGNGVSGDLDLPFVEGHTTREEREDSAHGQGLGLPLSRRIARNRGGDVWLASPGRSGGPGAVFCARLPGVLEEAEKSMPATAGHRGEGKRGRPSG